MVPDSRVAEIADHRGVGLPQGASARGRDSGHGVPLAGTRVPLPVMSLQRACPQCGARGTYRTPDHALLA